MTPPPYLTDTVGESAITLIRYLYLMLNGYLTDTVGVSAITLTGYLYLTVNGYLTDTVGVSGTRGGGGALRYTGGPHPRYVFRGRRGLFVPKYEVGGGGRENPLTIHKIYAALTPSDSRSDWAFEFAAASCCR